MRRTFLRAALFLIAAFIAAAHSVPAQQAPENFRWINFHSSKDQDTIVWITRSLGVEDWTSIRDIAVEYDAALVVTANRATPQSAANADTFSVWSVSLTDHTVAPVISGVNLRWLDWMRFDDGAPEELAVLYDNCHDCAASTYFTAFHYDLKQHRWVARWIQNNQGVPMWSSNQPPGVEWSQAYAGIAEPNGREFIATWSHFDHDNGKPADDYVYRYDLDAVSGLERSLPLLGNDAEAMELRICRAQDAIPELERGQDSALCRKLVPPTEGRKPVTTPPANNHGQMALPHPHH